jgi:hypothetical protein
MVEASIKVRLKPWNVPNFASVEVEQGKDAQSVAVRDIDESALRELAEKWLDDLYSKTDFHNPFQVRPTVRAA